MTAALDEAALRRWLVDYLVTNIGCSPDEIDFVLPSTTWQWGRVMRSCSLVSCPELLGRPFSPVKFWQYPTINALARFLSAVRARTRVGPRWWSAASADRWTSRSP